MRIDNANSIGISTGFGIPIGGTTNQVLAKNSSTNFDSFWGSIDTLVGRTSGFVNAGTTIQLDNIRATITTTGNRGLSIGAVSTNFTAHLTGWYGQGGGGGGGSAENQAYSTALSNSAFGWNFGNAGNGGQVNINDITTNRFYRITFIIGLSFNNNFISIERLS